MGPNTNLDNGEIPRPPGGIMFECQGDITPEALEMVESTFQEVLDELKVEWAVGAIEPFTVEVFNNGSYRDRFSGPGQWKYNFLLRSPDLTRLYINTDIFSVIPDDARGQIKHETAHIVISQAVGNNEAYKKSFLLEEGLAVPDDKVDTNLTEKIILGEIRHLPNPTIYSDGNKLGGDTNKEPFTRQVGYLIIFSFCDFLKKRIGNERVIEVIHSLEDLKDLDEAYRAVTSEDLQTLVTEWQEKISESII